MTGPSLEILAYEDTELGPLCLRRRRPPADPDTVITEITLDHEFLMSSRDTASERALADESLSRLPGTGWRVLVGGLGLGYTARAALDHDAVAAVETVEFLAPVVDWYERGLFPLAEGLRGDPRMTVVPGDVYARLAGGVDTVFDAVLIDVDHSPEERLVGPRREFYTEAGLRAAAGHLAPHGVLAVWSWADDAPFAATLREVFETVSAVPVTVPTRDDERHAVDWLLLGARPRSA